MIFDKTLAGQPLMKDPVRVWTFHRSGNSMRCGLGSTRFQFAVQSRWWVLACTRCTPVPLGGFRVTQAIAFFG